MTHKGPTRSFRPDPTSAMAGAIFISNTETREQCFRASIFGLPLEYESFVNNVKKGMPLFLFDHNLRKLYGVFEAASDGGLNINTSAFRSIQRSYPAQVRINIIWKCQPLSEDEFFLAIEENYYLPRKFYFDLSYEQVVRLYELFDEKKVERPIHDYLKNESFETIHSSKGTLDKGRLTPNVLDSNDQSQLLIPDILALVRKYSTPTSGNTVVPTSVKIHPNMSMPLGTKKFGPRIAPIHSHHGETELPYQRDLFQAASIRECVSTQERAPCSTRHQNLVDSRPSPRPHDYPHKILSSGLVSQDPTEGAKFGTNQSYPSSHGYSSLISSGHVTQNPAYGDRDHTSTTSTQYAPSYSHLSLANPQGNADYQENCDVCIKQCYFGARGEMYAYEHQRFSEANAPAKLSQQGIPAYLEVPGYEENTVPTIEQHRKCSAEYIPISDCDDGFENDQMKHGIHSNASDSSDLDNEIGVDMSGPRHTKHATGAERNTNCPQRSVFSRLSLSQQLPSQEASSPSLDQLVSSLSQKTEQWSNNRPVADGVGKYVIREQATDGPFSYSELNVPSQLELEAGESIEPQPPLLNFKRRSEARKVDTHLGKENSEKLKRRKLVRPTFGENNASSSAVKDVEGNCTQEMKLNHLKLSGNHFDIDLNVPASVASDLSKEDSCIAVYPSVLIKIETEKLSEVDAKKPNCSSVTEAIKEQDTSFDNGAPAKKISVDFNVTELNTMDESKLRTILGQTSSLLKVLGKLTSGKSNKPEKKLDQALVVKTVNMAVNTDGSTKPEYNLQ